MLQETSYIYANYAKVIPCAPGTLSRVILAIFMIADLVNTKFSDCTLIFSNTAVNNSHIAGKFG